MTHYDYDYEYRDDLYSVRQSMVLVLLPVFPAILSVVGSSTVLWIILSDRQRKLRRVYHRLLLAYSVVDLFCSVNMALSALVVPEHTPGVWGASGNAVTCSASGFFHQFNLSLGLYSSFICFYYLLILRYNVREATIARYIEPTVHATALCLPVVFGTAMLYLDMYNPNNITVGWCFLNVLPMDCLRRDNVECIRGQNYRFWAALNHAPFFLFYAVVLSSSILTYRTIQRIEHRSSLWTWNDSANIRTREAAVQASLYILAFIATYAALAVSTMGGPSPPVRRHRNFYVPVVAIVKICTPLQGFWNCFIFLRPRYTAIQRRSPESTFRQIVSRILFASVDRVAVEERNRQHLRRQRMQ